MEMLNLSVNAANDQEEKRKKKIKTTSKTRPRTRPTPISKSREDLRDPVAKTMQLKTTRQPPLTRIKMKRKKSDQPARPARNLQCAKENKIRMTSTTWTRQGLQHLQEEAAEVANARNRLDPESKSIAPVSQTSILPTHHVVPTSPNTKSFRLLSGATSARQSTSLQIPWFLRCPRNAVKSQMMQCTTRIRSTATRKSISFTKNSMTLRSNTNQSNVKWTTNSKVRVLDGANLKSTSMSKRFTLRRRGQLCN